MEEQRKITESEPPGALPERLALRGIDEEWSIELHPTGSPRVRVVERPGYRLLVSGDTTNIEIGRAALRRWLKSKACVHLRSWLVTLSREHGFTFGGMAVRSQRTRWGSCSKRKTISLNLKLIFLPQDLARCVLVHELCHTVHLNHSPKFRALLERHEPDCARYEKELRAAGRFVPAWIDDEEKRRF